MKADTVTQESLALLTHLLLCSWVFTHRTNNFWMKTNFELAFKMEMEGNK